LFAPHPCVFPIASEQILSPLFTTLVFSTFSEEFHWILLSSLAAVAFALVVPFRFSLFAGGVPSDKYFAPPIASLTRQHICFGKAMVALFFVFYYATACGLGRAGFFTFLKTGRDVFAFLLLCDGFLLNVSFLFLLD